MRFQRGLGTLTVALLLLAGACATSGGNSLPSRSVITGAELMETGYPDVYQALRDHPRLTFTLNSDTGREEVWLRGRHANPGVVTVERGMLVVMDGSRRADPIAVLRNLKPQDIATIRILTASEAGGRYGTGAANGVLEILTK